MNALGRHIIADFLDANPTLLNDVVFVEETMVLAAEKAGATLINATFHHFAPFGVSGVVVIQESHLAIHTWPEYGFASVDIFTCGDSVDPWVSLNYLKQELEASQISALEMRRGQREMLKKTNFSFPKQNEATYTLEQERKLTKDLWFTERAGEMAFSVHHQGELLYQGQSDFQKIEVLKTESFGKMLVLDGVIATTEADEFICHEMAAHVPMMVHAKPKQVLVIGGGDGGVVKEILKHEQVERIVLVEIDDLVVKVAKKWLPEISSGLDNKKTEVIIMDAWHYLERCPNETFDIIILDTHDPTNMENQLASGKLFQEIHRILREQGVCVTQTGSPWLSKQAFTNTYNLLYQVFEKTNVFCYQTHIPSYPTGFWSFACCIKGNYTPEYPKGNFKSDKLKYYSSSMHEAAFQLPIYLKELLG